jgi:hypothetical protein
MSTKDVELYSETSPERRDEKEVKEIDKLLELAEDLQKSCDESERRMYTRWFMTLGATSVVIAISFFLSQFMHDPMWKPQIVIVVGFMYSAMLIGFTAYLSLRTRKNFHRDARALYSIVDMLREIEGPAAEKAHMSTLERAQFRIRLSRFGIGTGSHH